MNKKTVTLPTVEEASSIAVTVAENVNPELTAQNQAYFISGFQECIKHLELQSKHNFIPVDMSIYKYQLEIIDTQLVKMPLKSEILDIQVQHGNITMWVKVDKKSELIEVKIDMYATGQDLPDNFDGEFLATVQDKALVWHFFMSE